MKRKDDASLIQWVITIFKCSGDHLSFEKSELCVPSCHDNYQPRQNERLRTVLSPTSPNDSREGEQKERKEFQR